MNVTKTSTTKYGFDGRKIDLDALRTIVEESKDLPGDTSVFIESNAESGTMGGAYYYTKITVGG